MKEIKLYVKTHNKTGLKYLGKTVRKCPHAYQGSGTRWKETIGKAAIEKFKKTMNSESHAKIIVNRNARISETKLSDDWKIKNTHICSACKTPVIGKGNLTRWHNENCKHHAPKIESMIP